MLKSYVLFVHRVGYLDVQPMCALIKHIIGTAYRANHHECCMPI